jgi:hypothetical protein
VVSSQNTIPDTSVRINDSQTRRCQSEIFVNVSYSFVETFRNGFFFREDLSHSNIGFKSSFSVVRDNNGSRQESEEFETIDPRIVSFGISSGSKSQGRDDGAVRASEDSSVA